jgi:methyl-accepting chemotaxis protein
MILALFNMPWSELAALVGLLTFLIGSLIVTPAVFWLRAKFVGKKLHYVDKDKIWVKISELEQKIDVLEDDSKLAKQPIITMEGAVREMKDELKSLASTINNMKESVTAAINGINTRVTVIEETRPRRRGSGGK